MKKIGLFVSILLSTFLSYAQTGVGDDFEAATLNTAAWTTSSAPGYSLYLNKTSSPTASQMLVVCNSGASANYQGFNYNFSTLNLTDYPYVSVKVKTSTAFTLRIDLVDNAGNTTNKVDTKFTITANNIYTTYIFDFTNKFNTQSGGIVNSTQITKLSIMINPGQSTGVQFNMDSFMVGSRAKIPYSANLKGIKLNQLGFFTNGPKTAVVNGAKGSSFYVVNEANNVVYTGTLAGAKNYPYSLETVQLADFSNFKTPGRYKLTADGLTASSYSFVISATPLNAISKASIKGFYYQRASTPLLSENAGIWQRAEGHPDNKVIVHNSAGADVVKAGAIISSPQGWYDAGDYNKYVVNAGISTYTLLACYEHFPSYYDTLNLNIPESNNALPDILDEALWEIRWLLTMQDPYDGGVYHKLTNADFGGDDMPADANAGPRYVVQKSTAATLDFAAIMAQAARVFANYPNELPGFSEQCIKAAKQAYNWAGTTPNLAYVQSKLHDPAITTGEYGDSYFGDELKWAMNELFTTTLKPEFYSSANISSNADMPGWPNVYTLGLISLGHNRKKIVDSLSNPSDTTLIKNKIITLAKDYMIYATVPSSTSSAYGVAMGKNTYDFGWGSNSVAANQALILIQAFNYTKDSSYLKAALSNVDYLLGRNPLGYSFVTGYGSLYPNNPHHRVSQSDGVPQAVPGLLVGGPNANPDVKGELCPAYPSTLPALSYMDNDCSYSTNEIAINWNAPLAYITGAVQSIYSGIQPTTKDYYVHLSTTSPVNKNIHFNVYPNPTTGNLYVEKPFSLTGSPIILDLSGRQYTISSDWTNDKIVVNTSDLKEGMYLIRLEGENGAAVQKFTVTK